MTPVTDDPGRKQCSRPFHCPCGCGSHGLCFIYGVTVDGRMQADLGWEHSPEYEPDPAGEVAQLQLLENEQYASDWKLDKRTREVGKAGVQRTIETWKRAKRT